MGCLRVPTVIQLGRAARAPGRRSRWGASPVSPAAMARPKSKVDPKAAPKAEVSGVRSAVTNIRSTPEWKEWLGRFADHARKDLADLIDEAVLRYARGEGFELPPKR